MFQGDSTRKNVWRVGRDIFSLGGFNDHFRIFASFPTDVLPGWPQHSDPVSRDIQARADGSHSACFLLDKVGIPNEFSFDVVE